MSKRRIIFLDVDGVLNHWDTKHRIDPRTTDDRPPGSDGLIGMDPACVRNFTTLIEKTGAEVVLSSTWRIYAGLAKTERVARRQGYKGKRWIDVTPNGVRGMRFSEHVQRGHEIQQWLDDNTKGQEVEFIIIDDTPDMVHLLPRLVHTDLHKGGFTEEKLAEALKLFGIA